LFKELHSKLRNDVLTDINLKELKIHKELKLNFSEKFLVRLAPEFTE
jgi:hypothetical protein